MADRAEWSSGDSSDSDDTDGIGGEQDVQLHPIATKWDDEDNKHPGFGPEHSGFDGVEGLGKYEREAPSNFQGPDSGDHQFMNSMIMNYALELADATGKPTGKFVFKKKHALLAAQEVLATHMSMTDQAQRDAFIA